MSIYIFPPFYPDEILYSWIVRFHKMNGYRSLGNSLIDLIGRSKVELNLEYCTYLNNLSSQLPVEWGFDSEYLILNHTVYPFFGPFLDNANKLSIINSLQEGTHTNLKARIGINLGGSFKQRIIKICPDCFREEKRKLGEAYIHRLQQIPGSIVCTNHNAFLYEYEIEERTTKLIDINECDVEFEKISTTICNKKEFQLISKAIEDVVVKGKLQYLCIQDIKDKYRKILEFKGFKNIQGRINQQKLKDDFLNYYPNEVLSKLESNLNVKKSSITTLKREQDWLELITNNSMLRRIHPIRHVLLIIFLFGNIDNLISFDKEINYFGVPPWPCLNPVADHYEELKIDNYDLRKNKHTGKPMGIFKCECGYSYTRTIDNARGETSKVRQYGEVWESVLSDLICRDFSIKQIKQQMRCDHKTIIKYASKLGLKGKLNTSLDIDYNQIMDSKEKTIQLKVEGYKTKILSFIENNSGVSRTSIIENLQTEYSYLLERDREWMEEILPSPRREKIEKYDAQEWNSKDIETVGIITEAIKEILTEKPPKRITLNYIIKKVKYSSLRNPKIINKLPLSRGAIDDNTETVMDFKKRKLNYIFQESIEKGESISVSDILSNKIKCNKGEYQTLKNYLNQLIVDCK